MKVLESKSVGFSKSEFAELVLVMMYLSVFDPEPEFQSPLALSTIVASAVLLYCGMR